MSKFTRIALATGLLGASSLAFSAQESATITVTATVPGVCKLTSSTTPSVPITANPSVGGDATGTAPVTFKCTKSHGYTFQVGGSTAGTLGGSLSDGAATPTTVGYTATWTQPSGTGLGFSAANEVTADVLVTIPEANYVDKPAGSYTGTLAVTIDY
jgi:hypothetical protein